MLRSALLGALTGALTAASVTFVFQGQLPIHIAPGLIFGIAFGVLLRRQRSLGSFGTLAYVAAAILSNAAAVEAAVRTYEALPFRTPDAAMMAVAGCVGGALGGGLLAAVSHFLLRRSRPTLPRTVGSLALAGALLGALFLPLSDLPGGDVFEKLGISAFYIAWQAGYAAASHRLLWSGDAKMTAPRLG